jgi:hypothetical protein
VRSGPAITRGAMDYRGSCCKHWDHRRHQGFSFVPPFIHRRLALEGVRGEIDIALAGHNDPSVNEKYGAKDKAKRFRHRLAVAVASVIAFDEPASHEGAPRSTHVSTALTNTERRGEPQERRTVTTHLQRPRNTKGHRTLRAAASRVLINCWRERPDRCPLRPATYCFCVLPLNDDRATLGAARVDTGVCGAWLGGRPSQRAHCTEGLGCNGGGFSGKLCRWTGILDGRDRLVFHGAPNSAWPK